MCECVCVCMHAPRSVFVCTCACICAVCLCTESVLQYSMPSELGITVWWDSSLFYFISPALHVNDVCKDKYIYMQYMYILYVQFVCRRQMVKPSKVILFFWPATARGRGLGEAPRSGPVRSGLLWSGHSSCTCVTAARNWTQWLKDTQIKTNLYL